MVVLFGTASRTLLSHHENAAIHKLQQSEELKLQCESSGVVYNARWLGYKSMVRLIITNQLASFILVNSIGQFCFIPILTTTKKS